MPRVGQFLGIAFYVYANEDHGVPHVHALTGGFRASLAIADGSVLVGKLPPAKRRQAQAWVAQNRDLLLAAWNRLNP